MNIKEFLTGLMQSDDIMFEQTIGLNKKEFVDLLATFGKFKDKTRKLDIEEKLFAILLYKRWNFSVRVLGDIILNSKNAKRDGSNFIEQAGTRLNKALEKVEHDIKAKIYNILFCQISKEISNITDILQLKENNATSKIINFLLLRTLPTQGFHLNAARNSFKAAITISYRDEANGGGAFYDHYSIQRITNRSTKISIPPNWSMDALIGYVKGEIFRLPLGVQDDKLLFKNLPEIQSNEAQIDGLLIIPGRSRETENKREKIHQQRLAHEKDIIKQGLLRGQPILAICAGSWVLWEELGGLLKSATDHNYGGGMPRIGQCGKIGHNKQVHKVMIEANTILSQAMGYSIDTPQDKRMPQVNSVHWKVPCDNKIPTNTNISARAIRDDQVAPNSRKGKGIMQVENNTIEAFESCFGAPILGIQWHPEAYECPENIHNSNIPASFQPTQHRNLILYMAKAGDAYYAKRKVLEELNAMFKKINNYLNEINREQLLKFFNLKSKQKNNDALTKNINNKVKPLF